MILSLILFVQSITAGFMTGGALPDGKVDKVVGAKGEWHAPVYGAEVLVSFAPNWHAFESWNDAALGVGLGYWNFGHEKLGGAITPYTYMDVPLVRLPRFELGLRPGIGAAVVTKTYRNTVAEELMFKEVTDANECIGSALNYYFPEAFYMHFPLAKGWRLSLSGGWYHISNGSARQPNSGYNVFAGELGVKYDWSDLPDRVYSSVEQGIQARCWSLAVAGTASGRQVYYRDQQTFFVGSMHLAAYWNAHRIFRLGAGVDVFYDGAYVQRDTKFVKTNLQLAQPGDCWRVGVSVQPEFVVGNFTAGIHVGAYMYDPVKELEPQWKEDGLPSQRLDKPIFYAYDIMKAGSAGYPDGWLYTELVLRYHFPWNMFVQWLMKSHLTKVEFISAGLGFYY
jgi:hypothetical protein